MLILRCIYISSTHLSPQFLPAVKPRRFTIPDNSPIHAFSFLVFAARETLAENGTIDVLKRHAYLVTN